MVNNQLDANWRTKQVGAGQFGNLVVVNPTPLIELNATHELSILRDETDTAGTGAVTHETSEYRVRGITNGDFARLTSSQRGRYLPGNAAEVGIGGRLPQTFTTGDGEVLWGYFDMEVDGSGVSQQTINDALVFFSNAQGTGVRVYKSGEIIHEAYQNEWNIFQFPNLDLSKGYQYQILYNYYGYGLVIFDIVIAESGQERQEVKHVHSFSPPRQTTIDNTALQVGCLVNNGTSDEDVSFYVGGRKYQVFGDFQPETRVTTKSLENKSVPNTGYVPIMSARRKINRRDISISLATIQADSNQPIDVQIWVGTSLTGASWINPDGKSGDETGLEYDVSASAFSGGIMVDSFFVSGSGGAPTRAVDTFTDLPQEIPDEFVVTWAAKSRGNTATVDFKGKLVERW